MNMNCNRRQMTTRLFAALTLAQLGCGKAPANFIGPGHSDFSAKLAGDYFIHRTSAHQIMIAPDAWNDGTPIIPTKVIECAVDRHFILAKRQGMKRRSPNNPNDTYEAPDPLVFDYWILNTSTPEVFGPMTQLEFDAKRTKLGIAGTVTLKDVYSFRP